MSLFGEPYRVEARLRTFQASPPPSPETEPEHGALERLLVAASEAEVAQHRLAEAKARHARDPSAAARRALLEAAADALAKEGAFDDQWERLSGRWFEAR